MTTRRQQSTLDSLSHLPFPSSTSKMLDEGATTADLSARIDELDALVLRLSASPTPVSVPSPSPSAVVPARPFSALRSALFSGSENPETFINDLERHYRLNVPFFASIDDSRRVDEARTAMSGAAAVWFDNLARIRPLTTWSAFLDEFRRVYLSARGLDNEFDRLRSLRMTGPIQEFVAEFNARLARCENTPSRSAICDFRRALLPSLSAELERSRATRFGGSTEWPNLVEIQSAAAALIAATPRPTPLSARTAPYSSMLSSTTLPTRQTRRTRPYSSMLSSTPLSPLAKLAELAELAELAQTLPCFRRPRSPLAKLAQTRPCL